MKCEESHITIGLTESEIRDFSVKLQNLFQEGSTSNTWSNSKPKNPQYLKSFKIILNETWNFPNDV